MSIFLRVVEMIDSLEAQVISRVACGQAHSAAISDRGSLFTWGSNEFAQLGRQTAADLTSHPPKYVSVCCRGIAP